jgi:VWFA-related protein
MKPSFDLHCVLLGVLLSTPLTGIAQIAPAQSFAGSPAPVGIAGDPAAGANGAANSKLYADGKRAINEERWPDAEAIFTKVAGQHGEHSDGALYWKAYAENKQGQTKPALDTCAALGRDYPGSDWIHECGALEIEIHAKSGAPVEPKAGDDDDLKLLALNALMKKDEARALAQIQEILNSSDSSEQLKKKALFILAQHYSNTTRTLPAGEPSSRSVQLDVVVAAKSGPPVAGLEQRDFTLLENKSVQPITSFKAVSIGQEPVEVILLLDAVNAEFDVQASERNKVQDYLRANGGRLTYPTTIAVLTDQGTQIQKNLSGDGNELSGVLDQYTIARREITRGTQWGAYDRLQISLSAIRDLTGYAATLPGRKIILWISPGWPMFGNSNNLDSQERRQIFDNVVSFSTQLRQAKATLYNLNPLGAGEPLFRADYYQIFLKGVSTPNQVDIGDLGLQVLAIQSGGLALEANTDVAGMIKRCLEDAASWYEITFDAPVAEQPNEYHHVQIRLDKPGLTARTRDGYYAQPSIQTGGGGGFPEGGGSSGGSHH